METSEAHKQQESETEAEKSSTDQAWQAYLQIAERIRQLWPQEADTQTLLDEIRK